MPDHICSHVLFTPPWSSWWWAVKYHYSAELGPWFDLDTNYYLDHHVGMLARSEMAGLLPPPPPLIPFRVTKRISFSGDTTYPRYLGGTLFRSLLVCGYLLRLHGFTKECLEVYHGRSSMMQLTDCEV